MTRMTKRSLLQLVAALDDAIIGWQEYTGPCHGDCGADWLCQKLPALKEEVLGAISLGAQEETGNAEI